MSAAQSLIKSYSFASRKRARHVVRPEARFIPAGLSSSRRQAALPQRKQLLFLESRVERVNGRVLARCFSISRAGSVLFSSSMLLTSQSSMLRHALEGMLRSSGSVTTKWAADATAGLVKDVLGETVEHLHKCASKDMGHVAQAGGAAIIDWLSKMDKALLVRLAAYSAVVDTPVHQYWEDFLDSVVMPADPNSPIAVAMKVLLDQGLMAPMATAVMILVFKLLEGKKDPVSNDFHQKLLERLVPDWAVWPMARVIEFTLVPQDSRPLFEGMVGLFSFGLGMFRLRQKLQVRLQALPRSVKQATSQGMDGSLEDSMYEQPPVASPFARAVWDGFRPFQPRPVHATLGRFSAPAANSAHNVSHSQDAVAPSHRCQSEPVQACHGQEPSTSSTSPPTASADAVAGQLGLVAAAAALRNAGIINDNTASDAQNHTHPTPVRVTGLAWKPEALHTPFSALAHEPIRSSTDSIFADDLASSNSMRTSISGVGSFDMEGWSGNKSRMSRLAVVTSSGQ